ncbi:MAG: AarF/ABC1/UbiB kinase family protein [Nannocystaceae bacterium]
MIARPEKPPAAPPGSLRAALLAEESTVPTSTLGRLWRGGRSALGVGGALAKLRRGREVDPEAILALVGEFGELKGVAMKVGQMLGYLDEGIPAELRSALAVLQTAAPRSSADEVAAVIRRSLGPAAEGLLAGMEREPIAVASIGQVHRARLPDGREVAVKIRHPGIDAAIKADFRAASIGKTLGAVIGGGAVPAMIDEARQAFEEECDFSLEADRQRRFAAIFADDPEIVIPEVLAEWSGPEVLVSAWTPGRSFDELLAGDPPQAERDRIGAALFRVWMRSFYRDGLFHGDPHPGNFAFRSDGRVIVYDFGCVREVDPALRRGFAALAAATRADDREAMAAAITSVGGKAPRGEAGLADLRRLVRGFFGPLVTPGARRIAADEGFEARSVLHDKRFLIGLRLPSRLLFLFRLRFGLYAVLARLGAEVDWAALEAAWAAEVR